MEAQQDLDFLTLSILVGIIFLFAGTIKGTLGVGLPTTSVSVMALFLPPKIAIALVVFPILVTNFRQFFNAPNRKPVAIKFRYMGIAIFITLALTTIFTARLESEQIRMVIGFAIILFCLTSYAFPNYHLPTRGDSLFQVFFGSLSGVMGGLTSIWAPPLVIYLIGKNADRETFITAAGFLFSVGSIPLLIGFWANGMLSLDLGLLSMLCIIPTLIGFRIGELVRHKLSAELFRKAVLLAFLAAGLRLIWLD